MNDKAILDILEQIVSTCKLLSQEVYRSLDYSNSTIDICANKFQELELRILKLQADLVEELESRKQDRRNCDVILDVILERSRR